MGKTRQENTDSSWNIDNVWAIHSVMSSHWEFMPTVWRWLDNLNRYGKSRKATYSEHTRHGAESKRHHSKQLQGERNTHCVFGKLKEHLGGNQFSNDDQVETSVLRCLRDQRDNVWQLIDWWDIPTNVSATGRLCAEILCCIFVILYRNTLLNKVFFDLYCSSLTYFWMSQAYK